MASRKNRRTLKRRSKRVRGGNEVDPTSTPQDPTSTPQNPTATPQNPTGTPQDRTATPPAASTSGSSMWSMIGLGSDKPSSAGGKRKRKTNKRKSRR